MEIDTALPDDLCLCLAAPLLAYQQQIDLWNVWSRRLPGRRLSTHLTRRWPHLETTDWPFRDWHDSPDWQQAEMAACYGVSESAAPHALGGDTILLTISGPASQGAPDQGS